PAPPAGSAGSLQKSLVGIVKLKAGNGGANTYVADFRYVTGWDLYYGFKAFAFVLVDVNSRGVLMTHSYRGTASGFLKSEDAEIGDVVAALMKQPIFANSVDFQRAKQRAAQRE